MHAPTGGVGGIHRRERGADASRGEGTRIAVREHSRSIKHKRQSVRSDCRAHRDVLLQNRVGFVAQRFREHAVGGEGGALEHPRHGPSQIDRGGPGRNQTGPELRQQRALFVRRMGRMLKRNGQPDRRRHADGRRAPDSQCTDCVNHVGERS